VSPTDMHLVTPLPGWGGSHRSTVDKINVLGHMVGQAEYGPSLYHAFLYNGSSMIDLGALPGQVQSEATAISKNDIVVGYSSAVRGEPEASVGFIWDAGHGMRTLGTLSSIDGSSGWSVANDVNSNGIVVGTSNGHGFVLLNGQMYDLNALVTGLPSGAVLSSANGINNAGQIVATATLADGSTSALFLDLVRLFSANPDNVSATSRAPVSFNVLTNDSGNLTVSSVDTSSLKGVLNWDAQGNVSYDPAGAFNSLAVGQIATTSFTYTANDGQGGNATTSVTLTITGAAALNTFHVESFSVTTSGIDLKLSSAPDLSRLNLYDGQDASIDPADLQLVGKNSGVVHGSLFWNASTSVLSFVATGSALAADDYTLTLFSRSDGVVSATGNLLDGNADNTPGGNYLKSFTVAPSTARTLSIKDFARGPSQTVNLASTGGIPVSIDDGSGLRAVDFNFRYDPSMLNVTGATLAGGLPADWSVTVNLTTAGLARLSLFGTTALPAGARDLVILQALVPSTATYRTGEQLQLENVQLNEGAIAVRADQAVHKVAYLGDATGNRTLSALDAALIARVAVGLDGGFDAYPLTDPVIVADGSGNGAIGSLDASFVLAKSVGLPQPEIPDLPVTLPPSASGPDPTLSLPATTSVAPGGFIDVPISITPADGVEAFNLQFGFDASRFDVQAVDVSAGTVLTSAPSSWNLAAAPANGVLTIGGYSTTPLASGSGAFLVIRLHAKSLAAPGSSPLSISGDLNEGNLMLTPVNGNVTVTGGTAAQVVGRRLFYNHSSLDGNSTDANFADDNAISSVVALRPGQNSTGANVSGFAQGINGIMIDVSGLASAALLNLNDFDLRVGTGGYPSGWTLATAPTITLRAGAGTGGADRIELTWNDRSISNQWLRVTLKADAHTGLSQDDLFYFGSLPGDSNGDANVGFADLVKVAQGYGRTIAGGITAGDINIDGQVNFADLVQIAQNYGKTLAPLALAAPTPAAVPAQKVVMAVKPTPLSAMVSAPVAKPAAGTSIPTASAKPAAAAIPLPPKPAAALTVRATKPLFATTPINKNKVPVKKPLSRTAFRV
jgi:probable HAF family extracellular repeat protein/VCBS repeat-containing protein